ncbi:MULTISPECIES: oligosaccharide flippase family protein [unclassified Aliiroseovarius]|uniref:oligosaccharide flippase family protein n=1 Tax=unclassified Aliiroseovarius TaxID=2623558 RepID=UPI0015698E92|nr:MULTISPECIES: oligosaccharide flippase family protein [unclassified Aliiroseovarius]NRP30883.1 hypothetical protein [Aliiroseovarius sp. xm-m-314]NRP80525.1 hypothetical protein [Aliiroseovarius sp. xm-v-209]
MISAKRLIETLWALTGVLFAKFFPLVAGILLIRIFGPEAYGHYSMTVATTNLALTATGAGLVGGLVANLAAQEGITNADARRQRVHAFMAVNLGLLAVVIASSAAAIQFDLLDDQLETLLADNWAPMLLLVIVQVKLVSQSAEATVYNLLKRLAFTSFAGGIVTSLLQLAGGYHWGVDGALWGMALGYLMQVLLQARYLRTVPASTEPVTDQSRASMATLAVHAWRDIVHYGGYMFGSSILVSIGLWLLSFALLREGDGLHLVAAFGVMNHWRMLMVFFPLAISNYLISRFAIQSELSRRLRTLRISLFAAIPLVVLAVGTYMMTSQILSNLYGSSYAGLTSELQLTAVIALLAGLNSILGNFLTGSSMFKEGLISNLVWFIALVAALAFLQRNSFDVMDALLCLFFAYVLHSVYQLSVLFWWSRGVMPDHRAADV